MERDKIGVSFKDKNSISLKSNIVNEVKKENGEEEKYLILNELIYEGMSVKTFLCGEEETE